MTKELRILILEDRPADAELVMRDLRKAGIQLVAKCVTTETEFLAQPPPSRHSVPPWRLLLEKR